MQDRLATGISDRFGRFKRPVAQSVEHYEIARYGTLKTWATEPGLDQAKQLLEARNLRKTKSTSTLRLPEATLSPLQPPLYLGRPSRNLRKTKSTSTLRLPEAAAATDSVRPRPFNKASPHEVARGFFLPRERKSVEGFQIWNETIE